ARPALTVHETVLRSAPAGDAGEVATLPAETDLSVLERRGGWYRVESGSGAGWLRLASLRFPSSGQAEAESGVDSVLTMMRIGPGTGGASSSTTTGVRGLDGNTIASASADREEVEKLESLGRSAEHGRALAKAGKLEAVDVDYLEMAELDEGLLEQTRGARSETEKKSADEETCYGDGCDSDIPFLGGG
ncbi:MAG: SH3 domain-containing protein, partial [Gammaproteobacteria bacterium]|nr:SH3 domain-containing protein [Gammaproteobacteria bacterium]